MSSVGGSSGETCSSGETDSASFGSKSSAGNSSLSSDPFAQIDGRKIGDDRGHAVARAIDFVFRVLVAFVGRRAEHQRQMPARAAAADADPVRDRCRSPRHASRMYRTARRTSATASGTLNCGELPCRTMNSV